MSNLTSILPSQPVDYNLSLGNSQTLLAGKPQDTSESFAQNPQQNAIVQKFRNYRPGIFWTNGNKKYTKESEIANQSQYIQPLRILAIYDEKYGLLENEQKDNLIKEIDSRYKNGIAFLDNAILQSPGGYYAPEMFLTTDDRVFYAFKSDDGRYRYANAKNFPVQLSPLPLLKNGKNVSKPTAQAKADKAKITKPVVAASPQLKSKSTTTQPQATEAASAKGKPGSPEQAAILEPVIPVFQLAESFDPKDSFYRIIYADAGNNIKSFVFTFLPARETKAGNWNVPEARAGLPFQTKMRHKMQVIPGAGPIVQTIGINGTTITLVGALLGNEVINEDFKTTAPTNRPIYSNTNKVLGSPAYAEGVYPGSLPSGAYNKLQQLTERLVYPGRPVTIELKPTNNQSTFQMKADGSNNKIGDFIRLTGVITAIRSHYAHSDRVYYALDFFVTDYPNLPPAVPNVRVLSAGELKTVANDPENPYGFLLSLPKTKQDKVAKILGGLTEFENDELITIINKLKPEERLKAIEAYGAKHPPSLKKKRAQQPQAIEDSLAYKAIKGKLKTKSPNRTQEDVDFSSLTKLNLLTATQRRELEATLAKTPENKQLKVVYDYIETNLTEKQIKAAESPRASLQTTTPIGDGLDFNEQLATASPTATEQTAVSSNFVETTPTEFNPIGNIIASLSTNASDNIYGAATTTNVLPAIDNILNIGLRPAQQKQTLQQLAASADLTPQQLDNLNQAISRYA
jgi:hypothetical protein